MSERNVGLTRLGYELFGKGDLDGLRKLFTEGIVWRTNGHEAFEPEYKGIDAVFGYFTRLFDLSGGAFSIEPVHILADDDRAFVLQRVSASRGEKTLDTMMVLLFEIFDGQVHEVTEFVAEAPKMDAFWA